ncbi:MAG: YlbL family protein [Acidimicrobiales bacterium]
MALFALGAALVHIPYYAVSPGSALEVSGLVEVPGGRSFPAEGGIYLTTVRLRQVTLLGAVRGWLDPTVEVIEQDLIVPPEVPSGELREFNLQQMDTSKRQAVGVAFEELGYDAIYGSGAEVVDVVTGSPADGVLAPGDVIVALGGGTVGTYHDVLGLLGERRPGERTDVVLDGVGTGEQRTAVIALGSHPEGPGRAFLGATLRTRDFRFDFPFDVEISSDRIGGPSAGLAFTLQVLDVLTEGELTGGRRVAATGTMELDGSVGQVGGIVQKTAAVRRAGIELLLVPRAELADATRLAGDDLQVEGVDTLGDALRALTDHGGDALPREQL